jgi:hypothetical protein
MCYLAGCQEIEAHHRRVGTLYQPLSEVRGGSRELELRLEDRLVPWRGWLHRYFSEREDSVRTHRGAIRSED